MHIVLTICSGLILIAAGWLYSRTQLESDAAHTHARNAEATALKLRAERDRVTVLEREVDALRRELRKLSGRFYAALREAESEAPPAPAETPTPDGFAPFCENYGSAQLLGPTSQAAKCECAYCTEMRARRQLARRELVPKTVRGQAEIAKLNAGKP